MDGLLAMWTLGAVVAYFVLKTYRSDHPVFFALVWPVGVVTLGAAKLLQGRGERVRPVETSAPPPLPELGGIGSDDDENRAGRP